jgi:hypothetical protein
MADEAAIMPVLARPAGTFYHSPLPTTGQGIEDLGRCWQRTAFWSDYYRADHSARLTTRMENAC